MSEELNGKRIDYLPENLAVNNLTSSWVEGVPGYGKNEKITFHNRPLNGSRRLYIINGFFLLRNHHFFMIIIELKH